MVLSACYSQSSDACVGLNFWPTFCPPFTTPWPQKITVSEKSKLSLDGDKILQMAGDPEKLAVVCNVADVG